jgi:hypothetical protein
MAKLCDVERCHNVGTFELDQADYRLCSKHDEERRGGAMRLRANAKKHTLRLVEVYVADH